MTAAAHRQQPRRRADLQAPGVAVRQVEEIVEEAILLRVPHLVMIVADAVHRTGDPEEVLDKSVGDLSA